MPHHEPRLARLAAMIADPARSRMLAFLIDGHCASAGELASAASVGASTASGHLAKLLDAALVAVQARGRHRYYKLADADVAHALEALAVVAERGSHERLWQGPQRAPLRFARCCYGHLAGQLGVRLMEALQRDARMRVVGSGLRPTAAGQAWLRDLGLAIDAPADTTAPRDRRWAYGCLDWSERRDHLAGALATQLLDHFLAQGWLRRDSAGPRQDLARPAQRNRALALTPRGRTHLLPALES